MPATYAFVTVWRLPVPAARVWEELERMLRPGADRRWWSGLELPMPARRVTAGERMVLAVRSPFGYRLRMRLELDDVQRGHALAARSDGDLRGSGRVEVESDGPGRSVVTFRWEVQTRRRWMNATAWALRPVFERAHTLVMRRGERGLRAMLDRGASDPRNAGNPRFPRGAAPGAG